MTGTTRNNDAQLIDDAALRIDQALEWLDAIDPVHLPSPLHRSLIASIQAELHRADDLLAQVTLA